MLYILYYIYAVLYILYYTYGTIHTVLYMLYTLYYTYIHTYAYMKIHNVIYVINTLYCGILIIHIHQINTHFVVRGRTACTYFDHAQAYCVQQLYATAVSFHQSTRLEI